MLLFACDFLDRHLCVDLLFCLLFLRFCFFSCCFCVKLETQQLAREKMRGKGKDVCMCYERQVIGLQFACVSKSDVCGLLKFLSKQLLKRFVRRCMNRDADDDQLSSFDERRLCMTRVGVDVVDSSLC